MTLLRILLPYEVKQNLRHVFLLYLFIIYLRESRLCPPGSNVRRGFPPPPAPKRRAETRVAECPAT